VELEGAWTAKQLRQFSDNFDRYRILAEHRRFLTPENREAALRVRRAMFKRQPGEPWTDLHRVLLVADWRSLAGDPYRTTKLEQLHDVQRFAIYAQLRIARDDGLISEAEWPRRRTRAARATA
jgi:hypothetical protein